MSKSTDILETVVTQVEAGRRIALCVVVATRGSTPQVPGAMICVDEAARITGTVGGGCAEAEIRRRALEALASSGSSKTNREVSDDQSSSARGDAAADLGGPGDDRKGHDAASPDIPLGKLVTLKMDHDYGLDDGLICGGQMDVAITVYADSLPVEPLQQAVAQFRAGRAATIPLRVSTAEGPVEYRINHEPAPRLVIAGGGHVGQALARVMLPLGFHITVIDDRAEFANAVRFPPPIEPVVGDVEKTLTDWLIDASTYVVIVTRGHKHDERALAAVVGSVAKYLGMIGSRRKIKVIFDNLKHAGVTPEQLDRVHSPIGLDIKAITPEEIAVAIAAELISVRRADHRKAVEGPIAVLQT